MLVVNYNGNKPISNYFKYGVEGNNNADLIRFVVLKKQGSLDLEDNFLVYVKCDNETGFVDKVQVSATEDGNNLIVDWHLLKKHTTQCELKVSLCFENGVDVVWQTQAFTLKIMNSVNADEEIENTYPTILQDLQRQIDELSGSGGSTEVEVKRVWLSYDSEQTSITRADNLGYYDDLNDKNYVNDSTKIFINFETTPINAQMKEEIKNGRFVIRLDYPIKNKGGIFNLNSAVSRKPTRDYGIGVRSYTHSFDPETENMNPLKKECLLNSLIFVNEEDIKINRYGEEYILKQISLYNYINNMVICRTVDNNSWKRLQLDPLTLEEINNDTRGRNLFHGYLEDVFCIGIPSLNENTSSGGFEKYIGFAKTKLYQGNHNRTSQGNSGYNYNNSKKLNPAFNIYAPLKLSNFDFENNIVLYSPYFNSKGRKYSRYDQGDTSYYIRVDIMGSPINKHGRLTYMVAKPRCAVLNDDYETNNYAFLRNYPQSSQQIKLVCKVMKYISDYGYSVLPIFRMMITPK